MATTKVGVYRKYHGDIPKDSSGKPLPKGQWPKKRPFSWAVRWFGQGGERYSRSFPNRKEAGRFAEGKQQDVRKGRAAPPPDIHLRDFVREHEQVMQGQVARRTLDDQMRAVRMFMAHVGADTYLHKITPRQAESFVSGRLRSGAMVGTVNKDIRTLKRVFSLAANPRGYLLVGQNPFRRVKQRKQADKPVRYVTREEFEEMMAATPSLWWRALLSVLYATAARLGEALNLT